MKRAVYAMMIAALALLAGCAEDVSVGVIGGADGPTVIFVSAAPFWWIPFALIASAGIIVVMIVRRRKRK